MGEILQVTRALQFNDEIEGIQYHQYMPFNVSALSNNDEIRITMFQSDALTLPSMSYVYLEGTLKKDLKEGSVRASLINNAFSFLFEEMRFEINSVEVDTVRNPGIVSTLKSYISFSPDEIAALENSGLANPNETFNAPSCVFDENSNTFNVILPLRLLMGFFEDHRQILINVKQELILNRANTDLNSLVGNASSANTKILLNKIIWSIPHVKVSDQFKLTLYKTIESAHPLLLAYRTWEYHEHPSLPTSDKVTWHVKTTSQLSRPRYVIVAFQSNKKNNIEKNSSQFDAVSIRNVKVFLNEQQYPYHDMQLDFVKKKIAQLYEMYTDFQRSYYGKTFNTPLLRRETFQKSPIIVLDCSKQNETIREGGGCDVRIEIETNQPLASDTSCYALLLHEKIMEYVPLTGLVNRR